MSGPKFFQTAYGKRFLDGHFPRLVSALERIADSLERLVEQKGGEDHENKESQCFDQREADSGL